jgi:hypothetical protein
MGVTKVIKPIAKAYSPDHISLESSLAKHGYSRNPGAYTTKFPYKEANGKYRTGLDPDAAYLQSWPEEERQAEIERIKETKARLEDVTGIDLSPRSPYYNFAKGDANGNRVVPIKLGTKAEFFNMDDPIQEITWNWLRVHPTIAPSLQAYQTGQVHQQIVEYYVADDNVEDAVTFKKKQALNKAIIKLDELNEVPEKLRQIARLMGLPASENVKQMTVYNMIDNLLKSGEFQTGDYKGSNPVTVFMELCKLTEERAHVRDIVNEAIKANIYRIRNNGKIYEGENEVAQTKDQLVNYLLEDKNQEDLMALEKKLKINKIADIHDSVGPTNSQKPAKAK